MSRPQPFTFDEFKSIYSRVPRLCIDLLIKTPEGYLLTLRQKNGYVNQWHMVGGTVYMREKITDAIQRVAVEEIGTKVIVKKFLGYVEYFSEVTERGFGYTVSLTFLCTLPKNVKITLDDQVTKFDFFKSLPDNTVLEQKEFINKII
ncbi:MAG: NUDIX domain-containing protein [Candidatus Shapirobacteria bacterium]